MKIGLIGAGSIGKSLSDAVLRGDIKNIKIAVIGDAVVSSNLKEMAEQNCCRYTTDISEFLNMQLDLVVEAASQAAVLQNAEMILGNGISMMIMSVGALVDQEYYLKLVNMAEENNCRIYIPSGAIGALDILKAAKMGVIESVTLTTRKPPAGLNMDNDKEPCTIYEGNAREAVKLFPKNVNVAMVLSLAGIGPDKTKVRIISDPNIDKNTHEVEVTGTFGRYHLKVENYPSPENPKTSYLASLSAMALLNSIADRVHLGT